MDIVAALVTLGVAACGDTTGPRQDVVVNLTATSPSVTMAIATDGTPFIECHTTVAAAADGKVAASWVDGVLRFYFGGASVTADSVPLSVEDISDAFGGLSIAPGETQRAPLGFRAGLPVEIGLELRYRAGSAGSVHKATTRFPCGPTPPGNVAPPTVSGIAVAPSKTPLEAGDSIIVTYTAASSFGLWVTVVETSGAFSATQVVAEQMAKSSTRRVAIAVPAGAKLNVPIAVQVVAIDGVGNEKPQSVSTQLVVADLKPPTIFAAVFGDLPGNQPGARLNGQFATNDTLWLQVSANDNNALSWLIYELTGTGTLKDSVPIDRPLSSSGYWNLRIPIRPEWAGKPTFSVYVKDAANNVSAKSSSKPDSLRIYPVVERPTRTGTLVSSSYPAVFDAKREVLYLSQPDQKTVDVYSLATMSSATPITLPSAPAGIDLTASGDSLIVVLPNQKSLAIVDLTQPARPVTVAHLFLLDTIGPANPNFTALPRLLNVAANGKVVIYINGTLAGDNAVIDYDLATGKSRVRTDAKAFISSGDFQQAAGATDDRSQLYFFQTACSQRYVAATDTFTACKRGIYTYVSSFSAERHGDRFSWGNVVYNAAMDSIRSIIVPSPIVRSVVLTPDGRRAYVSMPSGLSVANADDGLLIERISLPTLTEEILFTPDGSHVIAIERRFSTQSKVYYIDLR